MSAAIPDRLRSLVRERAKGHCEYCLLSEEDTFLFHEPDHILAEKHGGLTIAENMALACFYCNRFKGSDIASLDPQTGMLVRIFNPRTQIWQEHFKLNGPRIEPITPEGRVTERILKPNQSARIRERLELQKRGRYPLVV